MQWKKVNRKKLWECGAAFTKETCLRYADTVPVNSKGNMIWLQMVEETKLTHKDVIAILCGIKRLF